MTILRFLARNCDYSDEYYGYRVKVTRRHLLPISANRPKEAILSAMYLPESIRGSKEARQLAQEQNKNPGVYTTSWDML